MTEDRQDAADARMDAQDETANRRYRRSWYVWLLALAYLVIGPGVAIGISGYNQRQSEKAICEVVVAVVDADQLAPPQTDFGRELAAKMAGLRKAYDC